MLLIVAPVYYDLIDDFDLIVASFQQQYGIRLSRDIKGMKAKEFVTLLKGIDPKTPLGRIVMIRAETDKDVIKEFGVHEKRIYNEWRQKTAKQVNEAEFQKALEGFKQAFISLAGNGKEKEIEENSV